MALGVISQTEEKFRADPAAAKSTPSVTATLVNGRARLSAGAFNWEADLGLALGGQNLAPSPTAYLLGALAGCAVAFAARQDGVAPDLTEIGLEILVVSPDPDDRIQPMLRAWEQRCPIYLALQKPNAISFNASIAAS